MDEKSFKDGSIKLSSPYKQNSPDDPISFLLVMLIADLVVLFDDVAGSLKPFGVRPDRTTRHLSKGRCASSI